jgi:hypothetical protein
VGSAVRRKQAVLMAKPNEKKFRLTRLSIWARLHSFNFKQGLCDKIKLLQLSAHFTS